MESEAQLGPRRSLASLIVGLVLAIAMAGAGVGALVTGQPVLGWVMLVAGVLIAVVSIVQLVRTRRAS